MCHEISLAFFLKHVYAHRRDTCVFTQLVSGWWETRRFGKGEEARGKAEEKQKGDLDESGPAAHPGQACLLRPRKPWMRQEAEASAKRPCDKAPSSWSVPALSPEKGDVRKEPLGAKLPCPHPPVPPPGNLCSLGITPRILSTCGHLFPKRGPSWNEAPPRTLG